MEAPSSDRRNHVCCFHGEGAVFDFRTSVHDEKVCMVKLNASLRATEFASSWQ